jgi:hypothetical protein
MKKNLLHLIILIYSVSAFLLPSAFAASISGSVSYEGSQSGSIVVAVFLSPFSCEGQNSVDPYDMVELESLGDYTLSGLSDGNYYLAAVILTDGLEGDLQATDPWAVYDGCDNITPVVISNGTDVSVKNMVLVDGTQGNPNPFYSTYYVFGYSAHDISGYWIEIYVEDFDHNATAVSVTGPGIAGTADLAYNPSEERWDTSSSSKLAFTGSPLTPLPLTYDVAITDGSGTIYSQVIIYDYIEVFASNLTPGGGQSVTENPVFSWTGVGGDYTYEIHLDRTDWHKHNLTSTSILYDGVPLTPDTTYEWHVNVADQHDNISYAFATFVYQPAQQEPPGATTVVPSKITSSTATLWGLITPNNDSTTYYFEYGPTGSYGYTTSEISGLTGSNTELISAVINGLSPGTLYHYRVVAYNTGGISYGDDLIFTTNSVILSPILLLLD